MSAFEKLILLLQTKMERPVAFGWFHLLCLALTLLMIIIIFCYRKKCREKQLKIVLLSYGIGALLLELLKQVAWSFNYDALLETSYWDYQWYAAPFQLCTMPIYISLLAFFLKKGKLRDSLLSFMAFFTILGSIATMIMPDSCFTQDILINIHTMFLHCGSFVVSIYLLMTGEVKTKFINFIHGFYVFLVCVLIADVLNVLCYNIGILGDEVFNLFFISPYFISTLPVFNLIQPKVPYFLYLLIYIVIMFIGAGIVYFIALWITRVGHKKILKKG